MALVFAGPAVAQAASQGSNAAEDDPRVEMEVELFNAIVPQPYTPDPDAYFGPYKCQLYVRDYWPTAGCGGFSIYTKLSHVREQPGYIEGLEDNSYFRATVETSRTFGCMYENGVFDWDTAFKVEEQRRMSSYYYTPMTGYLLYQYRTTETNDLGPGFFVNFAPVEVDCAEGMTPTQHDLKVDDVRISVEDSPVFGNRSWEFGPFTAGSSA
ncbi:hypothetical protein [Streptomyces sporangiiformans]|uniref:Uncharacterized protein n=1 Tax=Streptomyces sporangiiformans TaxID=2315329 RepID=A0A505DR25_9ACTN|nr:hypothetical protein [Streptomyces sporangiiformans]TPQ23758.1 hypothetical protein FGD71_002535 [Streptomyces sporangiiformans]